MSIVLDFIAYCNDNGIPVSREASVKMKQAQIGEMRAATLSQDALDAARAKTVSVCKKVVTDFYTDEEAHVADISYAMQVLAKAWGKGIDKVEVPANVKLANQELLAWRRVL